MKQRFFKAHAVWHALDESSSNIEEGLYFAACTYVIDGEWERVDVKAILPDASHYCADCAQEIDPVVGDA